jgi:hypothetical protein
MRVDSLVDGREVLLDRKMHVLVPRITVSASADAADPFDPTVWIAEPEPLLNPLEVMRKSREIVMRMKEKPAVKLTVGDLSVVSEEKKREKAWGEKRVNRSDAVSVGDLSVVPEIQGGLQDLFVGRDRVPKASTSESQELLMRMQRKQRQKNEEVSKIKQIMRRQQEGPVSPAEVAAILRGERLSGA